jgi:hypothetical protein
MAAGAVMSEMEDKAVVLADVCGALATKQRGVAEAILREKYPFAPIAKGGRRYSVREMLAVFARDGFVDRYSGARLVCPATLRVISLYLPEQFPFHSNWRMEACHIGYWELCPTVDHIMPVARGGADDASNWITTSMVRNAAKANFTLAELGWPLHPPGDITEWDGLTGWFVRCAKDDPTILTDRYLRQWFAAASALKLPT